MKCENFWLIVYLLFLSVGFVFMLVVMSFWYSLILVVCVFGIVYGLVLSCMMVFGFVMFVVMILCGWWYLKLCVMKCMLFVSSVDVSVLFWKFWYVWLLNVNVNGIV